jgi:hypothetical protein
MIQSYRMVPNGQVPAFPAAFGEIWVKWWEYDN